MITKETFQAAKKAAKAVIADLSAAHSAAMSVLRASNPEANEQLIADMAWQCVIAARS